MNEILKKIKKIQEDEKRRSDEQDHIIKEKFRFLDAERDELYSALKKNFMELNGETIEKYKIKVVENKKEKKLMVIVNGFKLAELFIDRTSSCCSCEGPCDCETHYWHNVECNVFKESGQREEYFNNDNFAQSALELIRRYEWRKF